MKLWMILFLTVPSFMFSISAQEIIKAVDRNQVFDSQKGRAVMVVDRDGKKMTKEMKMIGVKDKNKFFIEFVNPEDKGVKYLRIDKELWIYLPDADDIMKISGHMLRQGMMGSDVSYEDMMSDEDWTSRYDSVLIGETNVGDTLCYNVELTAKPDAGDITYYKRGILVDKEKMVAIETDLFAKSGRLLKRMKQSGVDKFSGRYYATKIIIEDTKRQNSVTTVTFKDLEFDIPVSAGTFSKQNLKK